MAKKLAMVFGVVFLLIGVLGFVSNPIVGDGSLFQTNAIHNLVHIISGIIFVVAAKKTERVAGKTLFIFGIVYLLVAILGFLMSDGGATTSLLGLIEINAADNWLHIVLAVVFILVGSKAKKSEIIA
jgi:hypothetical protein